MIQGKEICLFTASHFTWVEALVINGRYQRVKDFEQGDTWLVFSLFKVTSPFYVIFCINQLSKGFLLKTLSLRCEKIWFHFSYLSVLNSQFLSVLELDSLPANDTETYKFNASFSSNGISLFSSRDHFPIAKKVILF